jgi:hypothetical protein
VAHFTRKIKDKKVKLSPSTPGRHIGEGEIHSLITLALNGDELSTSCPGGFTCGKNPGTNLTEGRVGHQFSPQYFVQRKNSLTGATFCTNWNYRNIFYLLSAGSGYKNLYLYLACSDFFATRNLKRQNSTRQY